MHTITHRSLLFLAAFLLVGVQTSLAQVGVQLPEVSGEAGENITIPIQIDDVSGEDVTSYQFTLPFDASVVEITGVNTDGTITPSNPVVNTQNEGEIRVSFASAQPLEGGGTLLNLEARLVGSGSAPLSFSEFLLFDSDANEVATTLTDGSVTSTGVSVSLPDVQAEAGQSIEVPLEVSDLSGRNATSYQFTLSYDPDVIDITGVNVDGAITPSQPTVNTPSPGEFRVSFAAAEALSGAGTLLNLEMNLEDTGTSPLSFEAFQLFDDQSNEVATATTDGSVNATGLQVSLPDVTAPAGQSVTIPVEVDTLTDRNVTSYEFTLPFDGSVVEFTGVNVDGAITPSEPTFNVSGGELRVSFAAAEPLEGGGTLLNLEANLVDAGTAPLSFSDFTMFNANSEEVPTTLIDGQLSSEGIDVTLPQLTADVGDSLEIPVQIDTLTGRNVTSYEFTMSYNPDVVEVTGANVEGAITPSQPTINTAQEGEVRVSFAAAEALEDGGVLLNLEANAVGDGTSTLSFNRFQLFDNQANEVPSTTTDGSVEATGVLVSLPTLGANVGQTVTIPVSIGDVTGKNATSYEFTLPYDPSVINVTGVNVDGAITPSQPTVNTSVEGEVRVSFAAAEALEGSGTLLNLEAEVVGQGQSALSFSNFQLFDAQANEVAVTLRDGSITTSGIQVRLPNVVTTLDEGSISLPINVQDVTGRDITAYQFTVSYDASVIDITGASAEGTISTSEPTVNTAQEGQIRVSFASAEPLEGSGTLLNLQADLSASGATTLVFDDFTFFDSVGNEVPSSPQQGRVAVAATATQAQFIHNAADTSAATVDVYFEDRLRFDDFSFRSATPFASVPAGVEFDIGIAPGNSSSVADTLASFPVTFNQNETYSVVANGVLDPANFAANPDGRDIGFDLFINANARQSATSADSVDVRAVHGATDAPTIDILAGNTVLFDGLTYGDVSGYVTAAPEQMRLFVNSASSSDQVAEVGADFTGFDGRAGTLLASGFVSPSENQDGPGFALVLALADGTVVVFTEPTNSPPTITNAPGDQTLQPGQTFNFQFEADDPDGDAVTFSLTEGPQGATIDTTGAFSFTPTFDQVGSTFTVGVQASDGMATADTSFAITVEELQRGPIAVDINRSFGDATQQRNYRLHGLPGQVDLPVENTLSGEQPDNWRVFWDNGASSTQEGLVEFDGSGQFNFQPGRGFWMLSRDAWVVSQSFDPVPLDNEANATISLHSGWNIISNPLGKDIPWSAVQSENGVSGALWSWTGSFTQSSNFASAQNGRAYYFLNEGGLNELKIPFFGTSPSAIAQKETQKAQVLRLSALKNQKTVSSVWVGMRGDAKMGRDRYDHFAPPAYFSNTTMRVENEKIQSKYSVATDMRPASQDGQSYNLVLRTEPGTTLELQAHGLQQFSADQQIRLYETTSGQSYNLRSEPTIEVTPTNQRAEFMLLVGSKSFVDSKQSDLVPQELQLQQNYPNPFRSQTTVKYSLPEQTEVRIEVYDILGRRIRTLVDGTQQRAGVHTVQWTGQNDLGRQVASGVYLARLQAGDQTRTIKMVVIK